MDTKTISITELGELTRDTLLAMGLRQDSTWTLYFCTIQPIVRLHLEQGKTHFDHKIVRESMKGVAHRLDCGEISVYTYRKMQRGVERLTEMHEKGQLGISCHGRPSKFVLNDYYEAILTGFI